MINQIKTAGGVDVELYQAHIEYGLAIEPVLEKLDSHLGAVFTSGFEYPPLYML